MTDSTADTTTSRRDYLRGATGAGLAALTGLAGCSGGSGGAGATGTLATVVKDAPGDISDFETCVVTIEGFWVKAVDGATDTGTPETDEEGVVQQEEGDIDRSDERTYYEFDEAQAADLVQLQDGETALVDETEVPVGTYAYLQLDVSGVDATLSDGSDADVGTPGNAPLQFKEQFEVRENQRTTFTADFTPVKLGRTGRYLLQPVATGTEVSYSDVTTTMSG